MRLIFPIPRGFDQGCNCGMARTLFNEERSLVWIGFRDSTPIILLLATTLMRVDMSEILWEGIPRRIGHGEIGIFQEGQEWNHLQWIPLR